MGNRKGFCASILIATLVMAPCSVVLGQTTLEEVTVTARKRTESFRDIPAAISVFTAEGIEEAGISTPHDFVALTPNMTIVQTQNPGNSFITIRGVSQARNSDMPVAVLIDGVLLSNPAQLNQELFDIQQIEVLKGAQGALYGRNAIGGAITINTRQPTDELEGRIKLGVDSGVGYTFQGTASGPVPGSETLKFRGSVSYKDTDGYLENAFLNDEADPFEDLSARAKLLWRPNESFLADARLSASQIDTTALYFVINNDFGLSAVNGLTVPTPNDTNDTSVPIRVNNPGVGRKDMVNASVKLDYTTGRGTLTAITAYDDLEELLTGDAFDFRPLGESFNENVLGPFVINPVEAMFPGTFTPDQLRGFNTDWNQSQWLTVESVSQEIRFTSPAAQRLRWITGAYVVKTKRFISTGNLADTGTGVHGVFRQPRSSTGFPFDFSIENPQVTFLSDSQDNLAWAVFGDLGYDVSESVEASLSLRYDEDTREQTTETPPGFIPAALTGFLVTGQKREESWDALQPKLSLRWKPQDDITLYSTVSRGFRSGGFNQSGVAGAGVAGVFDTFDEQIADSVEIGAKGQFFDRRLSASLSAYTTDLSGAYYFIFLVGSSTQNLGSLDEVRYEGVELEVSANLREGFDVNVGVALTDSEIKSDAEIPHVVGQKVPLSSDYTVNLGGTFRKPLRARSGSGQVSLVARADYQIIGKTYWGPGDPAITPLPWDEFPRKRVDLLDVRVGLEGSSWSLMAWSRNLLDEEYNAEFTHPFVWKALPMRWGVDFTKSFE
jgi:iron complex outermembrane receptor protein